MFFSRQTLLPSWLVSIGLCLLVGCRPANDYVKPPDPLVTIAQPLQQTVTDYLVVTGTTEAAEFVEIRARVKGYLEKVYFEPGQEVTAYQEPPDGAELIDIEQDPNRSSLLYQIEPELYKARLNQAIAARRVAEADVKNAQGQFDRTKTLSDKGAASKEELEQRLAALETAKAQVSAADAAIEEARLNLKYTRIYSPMEGSVGKTLVYAGNLVGDNEATHLTTVVSYDPIYANFTVDEPTLLKFLDWKAERDREKSKEGREPEMEEEEREPKMEEEEGEPEEEERDLYLQRDIDDGFPFGGDFNYRDLELDRTTGTYKVRAQFDNPDKRIPIGAFVRIRIRVKKHEDALLVPERVVNLAQKSLFVVNRDNNTVEERHDIVVGSKFENMVVIKEGITREDWIVIEGLQRAVHDAVVDPQEETLPPLVLGESAGDAAEEPQPAEPSEESQSQQPEARND